MDIGENIRHYRKARQLTQAQLADRLGVTVQAISRWETGTGMPDTAQLVPLAQALNISTDTLLSNRDREREYQRRWEQALRYGHEDPAKLLEVCLEILEEDPNNTAFLYRAAVTEKWLADDEPDDSKKSFHWSRSHHYIQRLLRLDPEDECGKQHMVEVLSALGQDDEAIAQAYRCEDSSLALLRCLKGDALRQHRQKRVMERFDDLLREIKALKLPEVTEALIRAAIPDGNLQKYHFYFFHHGFQRARTLYDGNDHNGAMATLEQLLDLAREMDESKQRPHFTAPLFDLLEQPYIPQGDPSYIRQFIRECLMLFPALQSREDFNNLIVNAMAYETGTE